MCLYICIRTWTNGIANLCIAHCTMNNRCGPFIMPVCASQ